MTRPGEFVTSERGKKLQQQIWNEIVEGLNMKVEGMKGIAT